MSKHSNPFFDPQHPRSSHGYLHLCEQARPSGSLTFNFESFPVKLESTCIEPAHKRTNIQGIPELNVDAVLPKLPRASGGIGVLYNPDILLVDDSPDDRFLLRRAFFRAGILNPLHEVRSGQEALAYLKGEGVYSDRKKHPFRGILLLDLNMPGVDGFGVLEWIRAKLTVQGLLIIVLSRSDEIRQVNRAYSLGANSFLTKPGNESDLQEMIRSFREYWLLQSKLPKIQTAD